MEGATYAAKTFADVSANLEKIESQPTAVPTPDVSNPPADTPTPDVPSTPAPDSSAEPIVPDTPPADNVSDFSVGLEDDTPAPTAVKPTDTPSYNWKEEIRKIPRNELLKEAGLNDFTIEMDEHISKGGKAVDYLQARAIDYNTISDEAILKEDLRKQYPTFTPQQVELMFNKKYGVSDTAEEEDKEFVALQLKADAYNSRQQKIAEQQKYKVPDTPIPQKDEAYEQWKQYNDNQAEIARQLSEYYSNHAATKSLNESKRVTIDLGENVQPFNFAIDKPEVLTKMFTDGGQMWQRLTTTQSGEPDVAKQQLIAMFSINPKKFIQDIFTYGQRMGVRKELVEDGQNATKPQAKVLPVDANAKPTYSMGKLGDRTRQ